MTDAAAPDTTTIVTPEAPAGTAPPESPPATTTTTAEAGEGDGGSWSEAGEATARSGEGTARSEHWRAAQHAHGDHVSGDKVAGDKFEMRIADRIIPLRPLSIDLAEPVEHAFVNPEGWPAVVERFRRSRSTIVRGRAGQGKDACAIRLLGTETDVIYQIDPEVDVAGLADSVADQVTTLGGDGRRVGFLLCQPAGAAKLRGFTLHTLEEVLYAARARLVITLPPEVRPADDELESYIVDLDAHPVDRWKIVAGHLSWRCSDALAATLKQNPAVRELYEELLLDGLNCRAAADLAGIISSECTDDGQVNVVRVRERLRRRQDASFDLWFDSLRDADERSFAVALAVLDGLPYEEVSAAARRLRGKLETGRPLVISPGAGGDGNELRMAPHDRLRTPTARLLQTLRAEQSHELVRYAYGMVPVHTVGYKDSAYPRKVIERIWRGYQVQPTLVDWLGELVLSPSEPVRFFAASTLGVLARYSFDYLCTGALHRWADSKDYRVREAVAYAMLEPTGDDQLSGSVGTVVAGWFASLDRPRAQATAARAYGVGVGGLGRAAAMDRLGRLATVDSYPVAVAIGDALADLILQSPAEAAPAACRALMSWFDDGLRRRPAHLAFLILASSLVTWEPSASGGDVRWPTLLHLARTVDDLRAPLITLWWKVLNETVLNDQAHGVLTAWAGLAENDREQLVVLTRLVRAIGSANDRVCRILLDIAEDWVDPARLVPLPRARDAIVAQLDCRRS
ncbi:hypothetical protein ACQPZX_26135 [Actinoplanes sp. CA-142083]|uniref:hypothetical protein n=1 Tax=Actinoplanes sp. CA-142083 TaxID=3239903 RepID=UPI003D8AD1DA